MNKKENVFEYLKSIFTDSQNNLEKEYFRYLDDNILNGLIEYLIKEAKKGKSKIKIQIPCPKEFDELETPVSAILEYLKLRLSIPEEDGYIVYYKSSSLVYDNREELLPCSFYFFLFLK